MPGPDENAGTPHPDAAWFRTHADPGDDPDRLARAELAARQAGYTAQWLRPWICQITEPDGEPLMESTGWLNLAGTPDTDPCARLIEAELASNARLIDQGDPRELARQGRCCIYWEQPWVCVLYRPDGGVAAYTDGLRRGGPADPQARLTAAWLALEAGL